VALSIRDVSDDRAPRVSAEARRAEHIAEPDSLADMRVRSRSTEWAARRNPVARDVRHAPNGVTTVDIVVSHGPTITLPVIRNAYEMTVGNPVAVRFIKLSGDRSLTTHEVPLKTFSTTRPSPNAGSRTGTLG
jgi:hypothetical protein